jgi:hypothetical protein
MNKTGILYGKCQNTHATLHGLRRAYIWLQGSCSVRPLFNRGPDLLWGFGRVGSDIRRYLTIFRVIRLVHVAVLRPLTNYQLQ